MHASSRFAVAIHLLRLVRTARDVPVTSEQLAESVNTNQVTIRRILGTLRDAGLVDSRPDPGGGWRLLRRPDDISLRDVLRVVEAESLLALPRREPNADCAIGKELPSVLERRFRDAETALEHRVRQMTLADVIAAALAGGLSARARARSTKTGVGFVDLAVEVEMEVPMTIM